MTRTGWTVLAVAGAVAAAAGLLQVATCGPGERSAPAGAPAGGTVVSPAAPAQVALPEPGSAASPNLRTREVVLFFVRPDASALAPQDATIFETRAILDQMKQTVVALVRGPQSGSALLPALPAETPLRDLFLDGDGVAYLDLGQEFVRGLPAGSAAEILAVGSLAHTLAHNFPEVRSIRILLDGEEVNTLGGHLDLTRALEPDPSLILPEED